MLTGSESPTVSPFKLHAIIYAEDDSEISGHLNTKKKKKTKECEAVELTDLVNHPKKKAISEIHKSINP